MVKLERVGLWWEATGTGDPRPVLIYAGDFNRNEAEVLYSQIADSAIQHRSRRTHGYKSVRVNDTKFYVLFQAPNGSVCLPRDRQRKPIRTSNPDLISGFKHGNNY